MLAGCTEDGGTVARTRLIVTVQSELPFGQEIAALRVRALDPDNLELHQDRAALRVEAPEGASEVSFEVHRGSLPRIRLEVVGVDQAGKDLVAQRMDVSFASNCTLEVPVQLRSTCREQLCSMETNCEGAGRQCVAVRERTGLTGVITGDAGKRCEPKAENPDGMVDPGGPMTGMPGGGDSGQGGSDEPQPPANACDQPAATRCPEPGTNRVQRCDLRDGVWVAAANCGDAEVCREAGEGDTYCAQLPAVCLGAEGEARCDGSNLVRCDDPDSWENPMGCANPRLCEMGRAEGACRLCETGADERTRQVRCTSAGVEVCNAEGTDYELKESCGGDTHCDETARKCITGLCEPTTFYCAGDTLRRCNEAGDGYEAVQQCGRDLCSAADGACRVCVPGSRRCEDDSAFVCNQEGSQWDREACGADTPFCVGNGTCVSCTSNAQCESDNPCLQSSCNTGRGRCTEPAPTDGACTQSNNEPGFCSEGQCLECARSSQCGTGKVCRASRCVECGDDRDCGQGSCVNNECVECVDSSDCLVPNSCAARTCRNNVCVDGTAEDIPAQCALSGGGPGRCNAQGACVECLADGDCPGSTPFCSAAGACIQCRSGADCDSGVCDDNGTCGGCVTAMDCPAPVACKGFDCRDRTCEPVNFGPDRSCALLLGVNSGVCNGLGECVECVEDAQCPGGVCSAGNCVPCVEPADCGTSSDCLQRTCEDNQCVQTVFDGNEACTGAAGPGICVEGDCRGCRDDETCAATDPATPFCVSGACVECRGRGDCPEDTACESVQCSSGSCIRSPGGTCAVVSGVCIEDTCCGDGEITGQEACDPAAADLGWSSLTCDPDTCKETFLAPCAADVECADGNGICLGGSCTFNCSNDADGTNTCPAIPGRPPLICGEGNTCSLPDAGAGAP